MRAVSQTGDEATHLAGLPILQRPHASHPVAVAAAPRTQVDGQLASKGGGLAAAQEQALAGASGAVHHDHGCREADGGGGRVALQHSQHRDVGGGDGGRACERGRDAGRNGDSLADPGGRVEGIHCRWPEQGPRDSRRRSWGASRQQHGGQASSQAAARLPQGVGPHVGVCSLHGGGGGVTTETCCGGCASGIPCRRVPATGLSDRSGLLRVLRAPATEDAVALQRLLVVCRLTSSHSTRQCRGSGCVETTAGGLYKRHCKCAYALCLRLALKYGLFLEKFSPENFRPPSSSGW